MWRGGHEGTREKGHWGIVPLLEILDPGHPLLRVADHLAEEVGEAGAAELGRPSAVEVPVIDGFTVGGGAEAVLGGGGADESGGEGSGVERGVRALGCVHCIMCLELVDVGHERCFHERSRPSLMPRLYRRSPYTASLRTDRYLMEYICFGITYSSTNTGCSILKLSILRGPASMV